MNAKLPIFAAGTALLGTFLSPLGVSMAAGQTSGVAMFLSQAGAASVVAQQGAAKAALAVDSAGWTVFKKSADTRVVYVSSSGGNDSNDGLSEARPKKTLAAAYALMRNGSPDWMLLKRGDSWSGGFPAWKRNGRSATEPMMIGSYGTSKARPRILASGTGFCYTGGGGAPAQLQHLALTGVSIEATNRKPTDSWTGILILRPGENLLIEDVLVSGFAGNLTIQGDGGRLKNVRLRRCVVVDAYSGSSHSQGMYADAVDELLVQECLFDHNGWFGTIPPTMFNHNIYVQSNCGPAVIQRNILARGSSHGIQLRPGGTLDGNLMIGNAMAGFVASLSGQVSVISNNVVLHGRDIDASSPRGVGLEVLTGAGTGTKVTGNLIAHRDAKGSNGVALNISNNGSVVTGNVVYDWSSSNGPAVNFGDPTPARWVGMTFSNNQVVDPVDAGQAVRIGASLPSTGAVTMQGNKYMMSSRETQWFTVGSGFLSLSGWMGRTHDVATVAATSTFPAPTRDIVQYQKYMKGTATIDGFLVSARKQSKASWSSSYTAAVVNKWMRDGFGMPAVR